MSSELLNIQGELTNSIRESKERLRVLYEEMKGKDAISTNLKQSIENALHLK